MGKWKYTSIEPFFLNLVTRRDEWSASRSVPFPCGNISGSAQSVSLRGPQILYDCLKKEKTLDPAGNQASFFGIYVVKFLVFSTHFYFFTFH
jgi:hypothetical protein